MWSVWIDLKWTWRMGGLVRDRYWEWRWVTGMWRASNSWGGKSLKHTVSSFICWWLCCVQSSDTTLYLTHRVLLVHKVWIYRHTLQRKEWVCSSDLPHTQQVYCWGQASCVILKWTVSRSAVCLCAAGLFNINIVTSQQLLVFTYGVIYLVLSFF